MLYLAIQHRYIRLIGEPSLKLDDKPRNKLLQLRKLMIGIQIYKYASVVAGVSSAAVAGFSWFKPEIFQQIF